MFKTIIIGVDGRDDGRDALALARALRDEHTDLILVNVYPAETTPWRGAVQGYFAALREDAIATLERARGDTGVPAEILATPDTSFAAGWVAEHRAALAVHTAWEVAPVVTSNVVYAVDMGALAQDVEQGATRTARRTLQRSPAAALNVVRGSAPTVLEQASAQADLVVVGSRGWGPVRRIALGSTSDHLVHHAACPVIVVPRPAHVTPDDTAFPTSDVTAA